jgi:hypothetical protein
VGWRGRDGVHNTDLCTREYLTQDVSSVSVAVIAATTCTRRGRHRLGLYPIVTFQYSSTTLYQFSYHIQ